MHLAANYPEFLGRFVAALEAPRPSSRRAWVGPVFELANRLTPYLQGPHRKS